MICRFEFFIKENEMEKTNETKKHEIAKPFNAENVRCECEKRITAIIEHAEFAQVDFEGGKFDNAIVELGKAKMYIKKALLDLTILLSTSGKSLDLCICCGKNEVTWPKVCDDCKDHEAQTELMLDPNYGPDSTCKTCGMLYDGGMQCTYCGDIDPLDTGEFDDEENWD